MSVGHRLPACCARRAPRRGLRPRWSTWFAAAIALAAVSGSGLALLALPGSAHAVTSATIAVDGNLSDWAGVRLDPSNSVGDTVAPNDPDYPGQPDRDIYLSSVTYDSQYLYFAWRRTASGTKAITFGAYLDIDCDGVLKDGDTVVQWTVSTGQPYASAQSPSPSAWILVYNQARTKVGNQITILNPGGDSMGRDGDTPDGWADIQSGQIVPARPMDGWLAPSGIECEAKVAWADLGVPAGTPIGIHIASGNGNTWGTKYAPSTTWKWIGSPPQYLEENRGQVEDNAGGMSLSARSVLVSPNNVGGGTAGTWLSYTHTITNTGNRADTFDLSATSSQGWTTTIARPGGSTVASLTLAAGETTTVVASVFVPLGALDGTTDSMVVRATSQADGSVSGYATDTTTAGSVVVMPSRTGSTAPGQTIPYAFTIQNNTGAAGVFDLTTTSTLGFARQVVNAAGTPISSVALASGEATVVTLNVTVPPGATIGSQDVTRLIATSQSDPSNSGSARAITAVLAGLTVAPNNVGDGGAGTWVSYQHTVTNSWPSTRTVTLAAASSRGWQTGLFGADGVTPISSAILEPNGGSATVWLRVFIPAGTASSLVDTTTVTATTGGVSATATDVTTVRRLAVYTTASYGLEGTEYALGDTVYGRATGLSAYTQVYFVWKDANGAVVRTSPNRDVDDDDMAFDALPIPPTGVEGAWTVELRDAKNGALIETTPFAVRSNAKITALSATDAATIGASVDVTSTVRNNSQSDITNSSVRYVIWWDTDGDGTFGAGDLYIDAFGNSQTYSGSGDPTTNVTTGVDVPSKSSWSDPGWSMQNTNFPNQGTYNLTATWVSSAGQVIDVKTTQFFSVPTFGEIVAKLTTPSVPLLLLGGIVWIGALAGLHRRRRWLGFYALGSLGTVLMALFAAQVVGLDQWLETMEARQVAAIAHSLQIHVSFLPPSGLAIQNHVGWGVFDVGIECSALLEMAAFAGLVAFYPGFNALRKTYLVIAGVMATYVINVFRILIIVDMIAQFGTGSVFIAHAVVGRLFFFTGIVVVYWVLVTMPTVRAVFAQLQPAPAEGGRHE